MCACLRQLSDKRCRKIKTDNKKQLKTHKHENKCRNHRQGNENIGSLRNYRSVFYARYYRNIGHCIISIGWNIYSYRTDSVLPTVSAIWNKYME